MTDSRAGVGVSITVDVQGGEEGVHWGLGCRKAGSGVTYCLCGCPFTVGAIITCLRISLLARFWCVSGFRQRCGNPDRLRWRQGEFSWSRLCCDLVFLAFERISQLEEGSSVPCLPSVFVIVSKGADDVDT